MELQQKIYNALFLLVLMDYKAAEIKNKAFIQE